MLFFTCVLMYLFSSFILFYCWLKVFSTEAPAAHFQWVAPPLSSSCIFLPQLRLWCVPPPPLPVSGFHLDFVVEVFFSCCAWRDSVGVCFSSPVFSGH